MGLSALQLCGRPFPVSLAHKIVSNDGFHIFCTGQIGSEGGVGGVDDVDRGDIGRRPGMAVDPLGNAAPGHLEFRNKVGPWVLVATVAYLVVMARFGSEPRFEPEPM